MIQQIIIYALLTLAMGYVGYRIYSGIKKKQACEKCELMKAVKKVK